MANRPAEIRPTHQARIAACYYRQSTYQQVVNNLGSAEYQKEQGELALEWGWPPDLIWPIGDAGLTGSAAAHRVAYQQLLEKIRAGEVGAVFVADVSRAGRSLRDFLELLEACRNQDTLLIVAGRVLNLTDSRDRLLSTLLANFAEFDNDSRCANLMNSKLALIRKGWAVSQPPAGYVTAPDGRWLFDPDPAIRAVIHALFRIFLEERSLVRTVNRLIKENIMLLLRTHHLVRPVQPYVGLVQRILTNPVYMGDYVFGRRKVDRSKGRDSRGQWRSRAALPDEIHVVPGHHDGYVSPQQFEHIQHILALNAPWKSRHNAGPERSAILQGLTRCGAHRNWSMSVFYKPRRRDGGHFHAYCCVGDVGFGGRPCGRIPGPALDAAVLAAVVARYQPPTIEAIRQEWRNARADGMAEQRRKQRELARMEQRVLDLDLNCKLVDPKNCNVKTRREAELEAAILDLNRAKRAARADHKSPSALDLLDEAAFDELVELCADLRALLDLPTTTKLDCKQILQTVIDHVAIHSRDLLKVTGHVVWKDGTPPTPIEAKLNRQGHAIIAQLAAEGVAIPEITRRLNDAGIKTMKGRAWTTNSVWIALRRIRNRSDTKPNNRSGRWRRGPRPELYAERVCPPSVDTADHSAEGQREPTQEGRAALPTSPPNVVTSNCAPSKDESGRGRR